MRWWRAEEDIFPAGFGSRRSLGSVTRRSEWRSRDMDAAGSKHRVVVSWSDFALAVPELAAFGADRLLRPPAYLATVTGDGGARVHPVTPIVSSTGLYVFMEPSSPKGRDLRERRRFAMHNGVPDSNGSGGEFFLSGEGMAVDDGAVRAAGGRCGII